MRRLLNLSFGAALSLLVFGLMPAAAPASHSNRVKQTTRPITTVAMDGPRVAYASGGKIYVWNTRTGSTSLLKGTYSAHTSELAIAGTRVALITRYVIGNSFQTTERLFAGPLSGRARLLASGRRTARLNNGVPDAWQGTWIAGLVGSGKVLAVSRWWSAIDGRCTGQRLLLITPSGLKQIVTGPGAIMAVSANAGRIAVLRSQEVWPIYGAAVAAAAPPTVGIYSSSGKLLSEIQPSSAKEAALSGDRLVVLTETNTFEVYNWRTGVLTHTWRVARKTPRLEAGHLSVYGQLATYSVDPRRSWTRSVHVLRLTTGRDVVVGTGRGSGYYAHDAALGPRGLVYAVNYYENNRIGRPQHGKLVIVPLANILAVVS